MYRPGWRRFTPAVFRLLVLSAVVLASMPVLSMPQRKAEAASTTQIGLTAPFLGDYARGLAASNFQSEDTQASIISAYGVKWASVWADFDSNFLRGDDVDLLYNAGVRNIVVRVGAAKPGCPTAEERSRGLTTTNVPLSLSYVQSRLTMTRSDGSSLVSKLRSRLQTDSTFRVYVQLGNEPDIEFDSDCDGTFPRSAHGQPGGDLDDLNGYSTHLADLAPQVRSWLDQQFGSYASRVILTAGVLSGDPTIDPAWVDRVFSNSGFGSSLGGFAINVYGYSSITGNPVTALNKVVSYAGGKPVYVGEQNISQISSFGAFEGSGDLAQPGLVKGYRNRQAILGYSSAVKAALIFTLGNWPNPSSTATPFLKFGTTYVDDYKQGRSTQAYVLDKAHLDALFARIPERNMTFDPNNLWQGTSGATYVTDGNASAAVGGSLYIYGSRRGWWWHPRHQLWYLVAERGAFFDQQWPYNEEFGILRAQRLGYLCATTGTGCYDAGYSLGPFRIILRCQSGTGPGDCWLYNVNGERVRNPFDKQAVVVDTTNCAYDSVSGFQVCGHFWSGHVSQMARDLGQSGLSELERLTLLGRPISTHFEEKIVRPNGQVCHYLVQYFERGVLRYEAEQRPGSYTGCGTGAGEPWDVPFLRLGAGVPTSFAQESAFNVEVDEDTQGLRYVYRMR